MNTVKRVRTTPTEVLIRQAENLRAANAHPAVQLSFFRAVSAAGPDCLLSMGDVAIRALVQLLKADDDKDRVDAASMLATFGPSANNALIVALKDPNVQLRRGAAVTCSFLVPDLPEMPTSHRLVLSLLDALEDPNDRVRENCALALCGQPCAAEPMIALMLRHLRSGKRNVAWLVRCLPSDSTIVEPCLRVLKDADEVSRIAAIEKLGAASDERAMIAIRSAYRHGGQRIAAASAIALLKMGDLTFLATVLEGLATVELSNITYRYDAGNGVVSIGDSTRLPRMVVSGESITAAEKVRILDLLRTLDVTAGPLKLPFPIPSPRDYCASLLTDTDASIRMGAKAVIDYLTLLRSPDESVDADFLLRSTIRPPDAEPDSLLRPGDHPFTQ